MGLELDRVVQAYNAIRDARTVRRHAYEEADGKLEKQQNRLKAYMLEQLNAAGAKGISTEHGTIYRTEKVRPSAADWQVIWTWMIANDGFDIMEKRLKATFVKQFMDEHDGALPPGVNVHREFEVAVRRTGASTTNQGD